MKLQVVSPQQIKSFIADTAEAYQVAYEYRFGKIDSNCVSKREIDYTCSKRHCLFFEVVEGEERLGGTILALLRNGKRVNIYFMFTKPEHQNEGVATFLWNELAEFFPGVRTWSAGAEYFAVPAIHFLLNKCHFKIIEFTNSLNEPEQYSKHEVTDPWTDGFFHFVKRSSRSPVGASQS